MCLDPAKLSSCERCASSCELNEVPVDANTSPLRHVTLVAESSGKPAVVVPGGMPTPVVPEISIEVEEEETVVGDLSGEIDRCEEEIYVLTVLKDTAQACLHSATTSAPTDQTDDDVPTCEPELAVRVLEALADDAGPTEGLDVRIQLQHAGKDLATSLRPSRSWASDSGAVLGRGNALHVTWNELFRFKAAQKLTSTGPGSLALTVVREDGEEVASIEVPTEILENQKVHHQWCTIGCGWRVYVAMQFVRSAADILSNHIADFEARLAMTRAKLESLQTQSDRMDSSPARNGRRASDSRVS